MCWVYQHTGGAGLAHRLCPIRKRVGREKTPDIGRRMYFGAPSPAQESCRAGCRLRYTGDEETSPVKYTFQRVSIPSQRTRATSDAAYTNAGEIGIAKPTAIVNRDGGGEVDSRTVGCVALPRGRRQPLRPVKPARECPSTQPRPPIIFDTTTDGAIVVRAGCVHPDHVYQALPALVAPPVL